MKEKHASAWKAVEQASIPGMKADQAITPFAVFNQGRHLFLTQSVRMFR